MSAPSLVVSLFIRSYRAVVSPLLPANTCRFYPTCSAYALEAFQKHAFFKAFKLSVKRILHCHPFHPGGYDPVP
ncbi:MAG: membrane protein insertion efficiency factor YidD [Bacteroidetes bacterium]|nr:MAG: membrane protein insertion efficiency factor YidD [Bacteroidota bacterium]